MEVEAKSHAGLATRLQPRCEHYKPHIRSGKMSGVGAVAPRQPGPPGQGVGPMVLTGRLCCWLRRVRPRGPDPPDTVRVTPLILKHLTSALPLESVLDIFSRKRMSIRLFQTKSMIPSSLFLRLIPLISRTTSCKSFLCLHGILKDLRV